MSKVLQSLIQGDFGAGDHGNFEAVILEPSGQGSQLVHWYRDNSAPDLLWHRGQVVAPDAVLAGSLIQSNLGAGDHRNFEVVVPCPGPGGGWDLWHVWHDNGNVGNPWLPGALVASDVGGAGALIQSNFGDAGNFEVVVPLRNGELWHFWHDNDDIASPWRRADLIATGADGGCSLIQSSFGDTGNFEVVVPIVNGNRYDLWHFWRDNDDLASPWRRGGLVAADVIGPGCLIQSDFRSGDAGNLEVVVPLRGGELWHFWHDSDAPGSPWQRGQLVTSANAGWAALMRSDFGLDEHGHGNFELLAEELTQSLVAYWHPNQKVSLPWLRSWQVLLREPPPPRLGTTRKVVQLTGEFDREGWSGSGAPQFAHNRTETQPAQIRGCDLGASFEHDKRIYFLFGDTWHQHVTPANINLDSIAFTTERDASAGLRLQFLVDPPTIHPSVPQREFNVPLDGTSHDGRMFVFFSTDSSNIDGVALMGRSLLTWCDDTQRNRFAQIGTFSSRFFVNVSVEQALLDRDSAERLGWAPDTPVLWVWGSGRYRASDIRLAVVALDDLDRLANVRYFASRPRTEPRWSRDEHDALPVVTNGAVGELSVRWNPQLDRYLALFNSNNPDGILMHSSPTPWGPWSIQPVMVFDAMHDSAEDRPGDGIGRFMHRSWKLPRIDHVQDDVIPIPGGMRDDIDGASYGPYQIAPCTTGQRDRFSDVFFTMSTWNPYQAMLMRTRITPSDLRTD